MRPRRRTSAGASGGGPAGCRASARSLSVTARTGGRSRRSSQRPARSTGSSTRADAAHAGAAIVADALEPTLRDVALDLGPTIDRIYPREARAALAGSTVTVTGRLRGKLPERIGFRFRRGPDLVEERRPLEAIDVPDGADVPRRWAAARIQEMAARGDGIQASIALAAQAGLLTPWTGWFLGPPTSAPFPWQSPRALARARRCVRGGGRARASAAVHSRSMRRRSPEAEGTLEDAAREAAIRRSTRRSRPSAACRDARAAARSDLPGALEVALTVGLDGRPSNIRLFGRNALDDDAPLAMTGACAASWPPSVSSPRAAPSR